MTYCHYPTFHMKLEGAHTAPPPWGVVFALMFPTWRKKKLCRSSQVLQTVRRTRSCRQIQRNHFKHSTTQTLLMLSFQCTPRSPPSYSPFGWVHKQQCLLASKLFLVHHYVAQMRTQHCPTVPPSTLSLFIENVWARGSRVKNLAVPTLSFITRHMLRPLSEHAAFSPYQSRGMGDRALNAMPFKFRKELRKEFARSIFL